MMKCGELTVIIGGMFAGKSTEMMRQGTRHRLAGKRVLYVKPVADDRYSETDITTHDGTTINAVTAPEYITYHSYYENFDVILFDEIQMYKEGIIAVINKLLEKGISVVAAGLDMDRFGIPFRWIPHLMAVAEHVIKLRAVCVSCGEDAWISRGKFVSNERIVLGASDKYEPLCRTCHHKLTHKESIIEEER